MAERQRLTKKRESLTYEIVLHGKSPVPQKVYVGIGLYEDRRVGEIFLNVGKCGSALATAFETWAVAVSKGLQFGVPLCEFTRTFIGTRLDDARIESIPEINGLQAKSIWDAVCLLLASITDEKGRLVDDAEEKATDAQAEAA